MSGWTKIYRSLGDHPLWLAEPFTKGQAWVDMIMMASWHPGYSGTIKVNRGELVVTIQGLSRRWQWSRWKVRKYLKDLSADTQIWVHKRGVSTLITLRNYDKYQLGESTPPTLGQKTDTPGAQVIPLISKKKTRPARRPADTSKETTCRQGG